MATASTPSYIHEFDLDVNTHQRKQLAKRLEMLRQLYNAVLGFVLKQDRRRQADAHYQALREAYRHAQQNKNTQQRKIVAKQLKDLTKTHRLTQNDAEQYAKQCKMACHFKDHLDSVTVQVIAKRAFDAYQDYRFKGRGKPRFKSWKNALRSISGKQNRCIYYKDGVVHWNGLHMPIVFDRVDTHGVQAVALNAPIKYCRLVCRPRNGKDRYSVQLVLSGQPHVKPTQRARFEAAQGQRVALDIGPSTIAAVSQERALLTAFCSELENTQQEIKRVQRRMSRSLRLNNPQNYSAHQKRVGERAVTAYKVKKGATQWQRSKHYETDRKRLNELHRRMRDKRKYLHDVLAIEVLSMGSDIVSEKLSYRSFQKNFGRSVGFRAPGMFISTLQRKAEKAGASYSDIPTRKAKLSQYDHVSGEYRKKPLSQRYHQAGHDQVQRDLYSAFLGWCFDFDKQQVDRCQALAAWPSMRNVLTRALSTVDQTAMGEHRLTSFGLRSSRVGAVRSIKSSEPSLTIAQTA